MDLKGSVMKMKCVKGSKLERYEGRDGQTKKQECSTEYTVGGESVVELQSNDWNSSILRCAGMVISKMSCFSLPKLLL